MATFLYHLTLKLKDPRYYAVALMFFFVALAQVGESIGRITFGGQPVSYYIFYAFMLGVSPFVLVILSGLPVIDMFVKSYHSRYYYIPLIRQGYGSYAIQQLALVAILSHLLACLGSGLFALVVSCYVPWTLAEGGHLAVTLTNHWLVDQGRVGFYYFQLWMLLGTHMSFYVVSGYLISVIYPNGRMAFLFPGLVWYLVSFLDDLWILSPGNILSLNNILKKMLSHFGLYHPWLELVVPYVYLLIIYGVYAYIYKCLLKRQWHFFAKE